ncbi:NAD/NADP transhydrogenase beta subunit [Sphingomonas kaistensis]|uniref:NAD/NADP transhydrogenase beta subunit n=1 Tax=Sphingomonas kaistensis TaxID=298708 RepID=A0A7X6BGT9_9SPHN|nr:hypothetical protein [Sphingomonas kaistensis]NJC05421.1 NAD/NADP transhydrogenase beta subunit [Sphingomonas kaistensis]
MQLSSFLRTVLKLDAASCLLMSAALAGGSRVLSQPLGLPAAFLFESGVLLAIVGLYILWLGTREETAPVLAWVVVIGNIGWALASVAALTMLPVVAGLGLAAVVGQAAAVLLFAALEWRGVRESAWASAR